MTTAKKVVKLAKKMKNRQRNHEIGKENEKSANRPVILANKDRQGEGI